MSVAPVGQVESLLRRITGERDADDELESVAHELRRQHGDARERRRRQRSAQIAEHNPRRGVRRISATSSRAATAASRTPGA